MFVYTVKEEASDGQVVELKYAGIHLAEALEINSDYKLVLEVWNDGENVAYFEKFDEGDGYVIGGDSFSLIQGEIHKLELQIQNKQRRVDFLRDMQSTMAYIAGIEVDEEEVEQNE